MTHLWHIHYRRAYVGSTTATCEDLVRHLGPWLIVDVDTGIVHVTRMP
jgi:hypothetical protein